MVDSKPDLNNLVERSLRKSGLWDEVKDRLDEPGTGLSGGQQQRLCIARAIAVEPEVILMDEPTSNLDQRSEQLLIQTLKDRAARQSSAIVIVTHSPAILARVDNISLLGAGKIQLTGPREDVLPKITRPLVSGDKTA